MIIVLLIIFKLIKYNIYLILFFIGKIKFKYFEIFKYTLFSYELSKYIKLNLISLNIIKNILKINRNYNQFLIFFHIF